MTTGPLIADPAASEPPAPPAFAVRLARALADVCDPVAVLLFGSWAKGTADVHSDVDLVAVVAQRPAPAVRAAMQDAVRAVPMHVDLLIWTAKEVEAARADPHSFTGSALSGALILHGALPTGGKGA